MPLTVTECKATNSLIQSTIQITFSDTIASQEDVSASTHLASPYTYSAPSSIKGATVTVTSGWLSPPIAGTPAAAVRKLKERIEHSALNPANYLISSPQSPAFAAGASPSPAIASPPPPGTQATVTLDATRTIVTMTFAAGTFPDNSWVTVIIRGIWGAPETGDEYPEIDGGFALMTAFVPGSKPGIERRTRDIEDAISYPILTEEVGYPPSPVSRPSGGGGMPTGGGGAQGITQIAARAIGDVLGWKASAGDAKGFVGALTQSFSLTEVEGRVESKWTPRSYTVQTDLAGGITGAQASLYARAQVAQEKCFPLLDGLYALNPMADPEYVTALRGMVKSQIAEIVKQFGVVPPSILRVNTYFSILLGVDHKQLRPEEKAKVETDPDRIGGTLGEIRKIYGIYFQRGGKDNPLSNSIDDEQNITNFRVISDYITSLLLTWLGNYDYFKLTMGKAPAFLGTQLILISRQFNVIAETVNEVRFALDSVFIGANERQQLLLVFPDQHIVPSMYLEDVLTEIESTVTDEGPRLIRDGGRVALFYNVLPVVQTLMNMVEGAHDPMNIGELPDGYRTARVRHALDDLRDQLTYLSTLAQQVAMRLPPPSEQ
jgi:hypothetical protein